MRSYALNPQQTYILTSQLVIMCVALYFAHHRKYLAAFGLSVFALMLSLVNLLL